MTLETIASSCALHGCPTIYTYPGAAEVLVQGDFTDGTPHGIRVPSGESLVSIPADLILQAAARIQAAVR